MALSISLPTVDAITIARLLRRPNVDLAVQICRYLLLFIIAALAFWSIYSIVSVYGKASAVQLAVENAALDAVSVDKLKQPGAAGSAKDYSSIVKKNILDVKPVAATPVAQATAAPVSKLPLTLLGTFISRGSDSYAIIEDTKGSQQDVFHVNESIFGDATLKKILSDQVEIERAGQLEVLTIDESAAPSDGGGVQSDGAETFVIDETELDQALENIPLLLTQARAVPYFQEGKSVGLRLFAIRSGSLFEKIGLMNGDILKSINGNSLADITQAMSLFQKLKEERSISLSLERNKQEKAFRYNIR